MDLVLTKGSEKFVWPKPARKQANASGGGPYPRCRGERTID